MVSNQISITEKFCKTATESIKFLEKLTMPYNILYAQNIKISLRNFQGWNSEKQFGMSPVNLEQEHWIFICGFIH